MAFWIKLSRAIDGFADRLGGIAGWATLAMVTIGSYNTLARYVDGWRGSHRDAESEAGGALLRFSSNAFLETQWYLFSFVFLIGAAYALRRNAHVRVDVLYGRLGPRGKARIDLFGTIFMLVPFSIFCLWVSWPSVRNSWAVGEQSPDPGGLARYPVKSLILVAFVLLLIQAISQLVKSVAVLRATAGKTGPAVEAGLGAPPAEPPAEPPSEPPAELPRPGARDAEGSALPRVDDGPSRPGSTDRGDDHGG